MPLQVQVKDRDRPVPRAVGNARVVGHASRLSKGDPTAMNDYEPAAEESTELDDRTERALTQYLTVLPNTDRAKAADQLYLVVSQSGSEYLVDTAAGRCECPDDTHRAETCKHRRRVAFATGKEPIPAGVDDVDPQLGIHVHTDHQVVATDGGQPTDRTRVPVAGGVLVFESRELGKELVGFEQVTEWDGVRSALEARGIGVGAIHHLPVFDESDGVDERDEPVRSEPADFGHGESTGVQML